MIDKLEVGTPGLHPEEFCIKFKEAWLDSSSWTGIQFVVSGIPKRLPRKMKKKLFKYTVKLV
jgi:hypothetical protein